MIGVLCADNEIRAVQEFFQLFKTPWEFYEPGQEYEVVLSTLEENPAVEARLVIIFSSKCAKFDEQNSLIMEEVHLHRVIHDDFADCPIYGDLSTIRGVGIPILFTKSTRLPVAILVSESLPRTIRVGFDLFCEVDFLLADGQPVVNASIPALDLHISYFRNWILMCGIPLVEIPPIPYGYRFFSCLTHDIDFVGIRKHKFDSTFWGFVYRALLGSLFSFFTGRLGFKNLASNWLAVLKLPLVFAGMADDFWEHFDKYASADQGFCSTFFLIPFKNQAGISHLSNDGLKRRGAPYEIREVKGRVRSLIAQGYEIGVHGIDAWCSLEGGNRELQQVLSTTGEDHAGIRMHWLYYDKNTAALLERAGFRYDASLGYNDAVGFRNGTLQVFKPLNVNDLLELPLAVQDTALFYPRRLNLTVRDASKLCKMLLGLAERYGGVLTLSWHDRSLEPERLWGDFYVDLLGELRARHAWVGSAYQITEWFRRRRSVIFNDCTLTDGKSEINLSGECADAGPGMFIRLHIPSRYEDQFDASRHQYFIDTPWNGEVSLGIMMADKELA
jgi:hypothetical protein